MSLLSNQGYEHFLTTAGTHDYAKEVLKRTGLAKYFKDYFGRDVILNYEGGKNYKPVANSLGFSNEEAVSKMIVIGNAPGDKPVDLEGLVFVEHQNCAGTDSVVSKLLLDKLNELEANNFKKSFEKMYQDSKIEIENFGTYSFKKRTYNINDKIKVELQYRTNTGIENIGEEVVPTITGISADEYKREPILVK